jgi:hypothetical protein
VFKLKLEAKFILLLDLAIMCSSHSCREKLSRNIFKNNCIMLLPCVIFSRGRGPEKYKYQFKNVIKL